MGYSDLYLSVLTLEVSHFSISTRLIWTLLSNWGEDSYWVFRRLKWKSVEYQFCITFQDLQLSCYANFHLKLTLWTIFKFANFHKRALILISFWFVFGWSSIEHMSIEVPLMSQLKFCAHFWIEIWVAFHSFFFLL